MHRTGLSFREMSTSGLCTCGGDIHAAQVAAWSSGEQWRAPDWRRFVGMKQIFFAVDHALFRECLVLLLERSMSCECIQASSFAEAYVVLDHLQGEVDLAIVDLDLRDGDGVELVERLYELWFDVPVLVLTADRSLERRTRALEAGADDAFGVQTYADNLIDAIRTHISEE
jgi:DNA-binding NarL/FixJ family response regulator